jgi:hypothetical protein
VNTVNPSNNLLAKNVTISGTGINNTPATVDTLTGRWSATIAQAPPTITVTSAQGGVETTPQICPIQAPPPSALAPNILTQAPRPKPSPNKANNLDRFRQRAPTPVKPQ